ncbi:MAG: MerR family transcriptional regulator [Acidimicrobiaceae bacterium]|nr:MerR family transcriptional regulator [Acidimicrobiaceae bacterium]
MFCHDDIDCVASVTPTRNYLSIGEVLAILLEEFPDVTISKIRFLESQGLIEPERTASGYRKFSQSEVDRLRFILREQRENYLPLKVIRTRLDGDTSDGILRADEITAPRGIGHIPAPRGNSHPAGSQGTTKSSRSTQSTNLSRSNSPISLVPPVTNTSNIKNAQASSFNRSEIIAAAKIDEKTLLELERFGILKSRRVGETDLYDNIDLDILVASAKFLSLGIDARHLKAWRLAADQEVSLFETRVVPLMRQRNPAARRDAMSLFAELVDQGGRLRAALIAAQTRDHLDKH